MKVAEEYCWAITQAAERLYCARSKSQCIGVRISAGLHEQLTKVIFNIGLLKIRFHRIFWNLTVAQVGGVSVLRTVSLSKTLPIDLSLLK
jgi:hypothetical protein